jgi:hypothetical protein
MANKRTSPSACCRAAADAGGSAACAGLCLTLDACCVRAPELVPAAEDHAWRLLPAALRHCAALDRATPSLRAASGLAGAAEVALPRMAAPLHCSAALPIACPLRAGRCFRWVARPSSFLLRGWLWMDCRVQRQASAARAFGASAVGAC